MKAESRALATAIGFTAADLQANRQGKLSQAQMERLRRDRRREALMAGVVFAALALAATVALYLGQVERNVILSGAGAALILLNAIIVGRAGRAFMRVDADLRAGGVETLAGEVERVLRRGPAGDRCLLRIADTDILASRDVFVGFAHLSPYRIYRTRVSRQLLSAEPIP